MTDEEFDDAIENLELQAKRFQKNKGKIVELLSYASSRRQESEDEDKTEWRKETNRLDALRNACNNIEKALMK